VGVDRLVAAVSPAWALRRARARVELERLERGRNLVRRYEGADRGRRTSGWFALDSSPTAATRGALHQLRARCRDLRRNNVWAQAAVRELAAHVVGKGVRPRFVHDEDSELRLAAEAWDEWAQSTTQADASERETFYGLQAAAFEGVVDGGETLVRRRFRRLTDALAVPLQVQLLEGDHLDTLRDLERSRTNNRVVQGVAFDAIGRREGYWLYPEHPGDSFQSFAVTQSAFVPSSEVRHVFRADRIGQVRGVPWGSVAALRLHDFDAYEDNEQLRMVVATAYAGFVEDQAGADLSFTDGIAAAGLASQDNRDRLGQPIDRLQSGTVEYLPPGKKITFPSPPQNDGFGSFAGYALRAVARGYGLPAWLLSGDLSQVNFSSIRADWIAFQRDVDVWRDRILLPHLCEPVLRWWRDAAELVDVLTPGRADQGRLRWEWIPPRREMLDPRTEVMAEIESVRAGFKSLSQVVSSLGSDPEKVLDALADDLEGARARGLTLTTDGANAAPGKVGGVNGNGSGPPDSPSGTADDPNAADAEADDQASRALLSRLRARGFSAAEAVRTIVGA
jgi:lambda family phage portal protein